MKKLLLASLAVLAMGAQAAGLSSPVSHAFSATVSLTADCIANSANAAANTLQFAPYTGFGAASNATQILSSLDCTNNMSAPTASLSSTGGVIAGLAYSLTMGTQTVANGGDSNQATSTAAAADVYSVTVDGVIAAGQPGEVGATATQARAVTWTF